MIHMEVILDPFTQCGLSMKVVPLFCHASFYKRAVSKGSSELSLHLCEESAAFCEATEIVCHHEPFLMLRRHSPTQNSYCHGSCLEKTFCCVCPTRSHLNSSDTGITFLIQPTEYWHIIVQIIVKTAFIYPFPAVGSV